MLKYIVALWARLPFGNYNPTIPSQIETERLHVPVTFSPSFRIEGTGPAPEEFDYRQLFDMSLYSASTLGTTMTWASRVKQPPRVVIQPSTSAKPACASLSITKDSSLRGCNKMSPLPNPATKTEDEEVVAKKKKPRKKKNKPNPKGEQSESLKVLNENIAIQEPPKIQDDDEFPDLMSSVSVAERGFKPDHQNNPSYNWRPQEASVSSSKRKGSGKKSKDFVQLDLGGVLAALEQKQLLDKAKQSTKTLTLSVGGGVPVLSREPTNVSKHPPTKQSQAPHNPLDSSAPLVKKGKQREVPKTKKPTSLKKIILKEREQRKQFQAALSQDAPQQAVEAGSNETEGSAECEEVGSAECEQPPAAEDMGICEDKMQPVGGSSAEITESTQNLLDATGGGVPTQQPNSNVPKIHSRRFREYCSQVLSKEVDTCTTDLLKELVRFQDRMYLKDPVKAKTKRRLVMGLREVLKHLKLKKLKCIIISPNCEKIQSKGGLDETLQTIINCACEQNVPFVFALNRKALGRCLNKAVPVSVVGIFSYDGAQDQFHKLHDLTMQARQAYKDMIASLQEQEMEELEDDSTVETVLDKSQQKPVEVSTKSTAEETDEPNYIKVWKRMLEEQYTPYALNLEETVANDLFNFHLS